MRILHLAKYYWPRSGGMERVVRDLSEGVRALGHQVEVVSIRTFGDAGKRRESRSVTRAFSFGALGAQEIAPGYIAAAWRRADIIHLHHPHSLADIAVLLRAGRTPVVVTQHADAKRGVYRSLSRLVLRRSESIVVPSRAHVAMSSEIRGFESKVQVIPFGIDESRWMSVPAPAGGQPRALFIGHLVAYKGIDVLLKALERVPEVRLDIVGSGPEGPRLKTLAQALAITDRIRWFGEYPDEDLPRRMADADFLVLPSVTTDEMFGLVVLEAMASGRPVVTTAVPSAVREVNVAGVTGLEVPIRDVGALAGALRQLARDPARRAAMGVAGRERVRQHFTRSLMAERHIALYQDVMTGWAPFGAA